jgi:hypothetical protein
MSHGLTIQWRLESPSLHEACPTTERCVRRHGEGEEG